MELVGEARENGARRHKACDMLEISVRTLQRWEKEPGEGDQRAGPKSVPSNSLSEAEKDLVEAVATSPQFRDVSPAQIVPILAEDGVYVASESSFYRILREKKMLAHRSSARPASHSRPTEYAATGPNQVWSWDISYLKSSVKGQFYFLYLVVDIFSRMIVGWAVHEEESEELARDLIRQTCLRHGVDQKQLVLHSDNGGPMKGATMLATLQWLGIVPSFSRPKVSDDNPYSESLFRTLKYRPCYPSVPFDSLEAARGWVEEFERWYNHEHRHSGIRFLTPASRHYGQEESILARRKEAYEEARRQRPDRWSRGTRNWERITVVRLNPEKRTERAERPLQESA